MSRYSSSGAKSFRYRQIGHDEYRISWVIDFYYKNSPLRWPRKFTRITDKKGAERFCKKHGLPAPG